MRNAVLSSSTLAVLSAAQALAQSTFDDVHPVFRAYCADCHSTQGNGGLDIAAGDITTAYASSQLPSYFVPGQTKGFAALVRIQNGDMPLGAGCSGTPAADATTPACLTASEQGRLQTWIQDGQPGPLPTTGATYCFGDGGGTPCPCGKGVAWVSLGGLCPFASARTGGEAFGCGAQQVVLSAWAGLVGPGRCRGPGAARQVRDEASRAHPPEARRERFATRWLEAPRSEGSDLRGA
jgi:hypothetical protein